MMSLRLPHVLALAVAGSLLAGPLLAEATKTKGKKSTSAQSTKSEDSAESEATPSGTPKKKKSSPTPGRRKSSPSPKPQSAGAETPSTPKATPRTTPKPTPNTAANATPTPTPTGSPQPSPKPNIAPNATLQPDELVEYADQPAPVKALISEVLALTTQNLTYKYGSADPASGGMDCSGTIYYVFRKAGFDSVPRDSSGQYAWTRKAKGFRAVISRSLDSFEFDELLPGDLLFWTGTYQVDREIPVSHVMLYLGTERKTKKRVMAGASDGRSYAGVQRWGVSVFDFQMPRAPAEGAERRGATFIGYGRIPGLRDVASIVAKAEPTAAADPVNVTEEPAADATPSPKGSKAASAKKSTIKSRTRSRKE